MSRCAKLEQYKAENVALRALIREPESDDFNAAEKVKSDGISEAKMKLEEKYAEKEKGSKSENLLLKKQVEKLEQEVAALRSQMDQGAGQAEPVHNARGAGRKPDYAKRQLFVQLYTAGTDMDTIMEQMQIGRRTYYRYLAAYRESVDN